MIEMKSHRNAGVSTSIRGGSYKGGSSVCHGPWKQEDHGGRLQGFGCSDCCDYTLEVVAAHAGDCIALRASSVKDSEGFVGYCFFGHDDGIAVDVY